MTKGILPLSIAWAVLAFPSPQPPAEEGGQTSFSLAPSVRAVEASRVFRLNTVTKGDQRWPEIAIADDASTIVAGWASVGPRGDRWRVVAQRFDASGAKLGSEFDVDDFRSEERPNAEDPSIDFDANGNFVIAWHSQGTDEGDGGWTVWQRRYHRDGTPYGPGTRVPTNTACDQWRPTAMVAASGSAMVTWYSDVPPCGGDASEIRGRTLDAAGAFTGDEFRISGAGKLRRLQWRQGACSRAGVFVSQWYVEKPTLTCYARAFDARGRPLGDARTFREWLNVGVRGDGRWLATAGASGRWHLPNGVPVGSTMAVSGGEIAMNAAGAFVTIAVTTGVGGPGLYAYPYDSAGKSAGAPIALSPGHPQPGGPPHVDMSEDGTIVATWEAPGDDEGAAVWGAIARHPRARGGRGGS